MILATIIICVAMSPAACSETTGYRVVRIEQPFSSVLQCQASVLMVMPMIAHKKGDTFRIVCGGRYARIIGADI